jgi:hypothetical protein
MPRGQHDAGANDAGPDAAATPGPDADLRDSGTSGGGEHDGGEGDAGGPCSCAGEHELCTPDGRCVDYCAYERLPGSLAAERPTPITCAKANATDPDLTFAQLCERRCQLQCRLQGWFCGEPCAEDACDPGNSTMLAACSEACGADLSCIQASCQAARAAGCAQTKCPGNQPPSCSDAHCTNDCRFNFDGWCDDGDVFGTLDVTVVDNMDSAECGWGHDCADCGPRHGSDPSRNLPAGAQCRFNSNCAGFAQRVVEGEIQVDIANTKAWCATFHQPVDGNFRCLPDASGEGETCPSHYTTVTVVSANGEPLMSDGVQALVCAPLPGFCD